MPAGLPRGHGGRTCGFGVWEEVRCERRGSERVVRKCCKLGGELGLGGGPAFAFATELVEELARRGKLLLRALEAVGKWGGGMGFRG